MAVQLKVSVLFGGGVSGFVEEGQKDEGEARLHAMVLIGAYHDKDKEYNDRYWFLLQNTHQNSYFKLVDGEYLASCDATVYFAGPKVDMSLENNFNVVVGEYSEVEYELEECREFEQEEVGWSDFDYNLQGDY